MSSSTSTTQPSSQTELRRLVLASGSPRRVELLRGLGLSFDVFPSHVDETVAPTLSPREVVEELAQRKARAVAQTLVDRAAETDAAHALPLARPVDAAADASVSAALVIGSDTVVVLDDIILGKPADEQDAVRMLSQLQGRTHHVYTGLCVTDLSGRIDVAHRRTAVTMRSLTQAQIGRYVASGEPLDKAGAYAIQGYGATLVTGIDGDYFTVVGMPLALLRDMLAARGVDILLL